MRRLAALAALALSLPAAAQPLPRWTFCVATAADSDEIFMSPVFAADGPRERLEGAFAKTVEKLGAAGASARCASPRADRAVALRALVGAEAVDRERGATLHAVAASDFPGDDAFSPQRAQKSPRPGEDLGGDPGLAAAPEARPDQRRGQEAAAPDRSSLLPAIPGSSPPPSAETGTERGAIAGAGLSYSEMRATAGSGAPDQVSRKRPPGATDCTACGRKATTQVPPARRTDG